MDSFTNLLAKQTARTHPVIIADGVSSARSRPYPIFIMPCRSSRCPLPPPPSFIRFLSGHGSNWSGLFSRHPALVTGYRCYTLNPRDYPCQPGTIRAYRWLRVPYGSTMVERGPVCWIRTLVALLAIQLVKNILRTFSST